MSSLSQKSFASGELTPSLHANVNLSKYQSGLATCRNFMVMRHGGVSNRPGTSFVGEVKDSTKSVRLIPFIFNSSQTYVLEFGDQYIRVIKDGSQVLETAKNITAATQANPCQLTVTGHGYTTGQEVYVSGISGMTELNNRNFKITVVDTNNITLSYMNGSAVNSTGFGAYVSGGTVKRVYTISSPYVKADLPALKFIQSADVVTLTHPSYEVRELSRSGDTSWSLSVVTFEPSIPAIGSISSSVIGTTGSTEYKYRITAVSSETFEESLAGATETISNGNATLSNSNYNNITWTDYGSGYQYNVYRYTGNVYGLLAITEAPSYADKGLVDPDPSINPPSARNPFASAGEYPACCTYYQQRLFFANQDNNTEAVYSSRIGAFKNFTQSLYSQDDEAVTFSMTGRQVNSVNHLLDLAALIIFTDSGEWTAQGDAAGTITPTSINLKQYSYNGSHPNLSPIVIGNNAIYVQKDGAIVRDLGFNYQVDGYSGNDLTIFANHLLEGFEIVDWSYAKSPNSIVWAVRDDGTLLGLTYLKEQEMLGWHRHDFQDDTYCENVCVVPEGNESAVYLTINRVIDGQEKRYIERFSTRFISDIKDAKFLDSHLSYDGRNVGSTTMTLSGSGWTYNDTLTLTASASTFSSTSVGNEVHFYLDDGSVLRCSITAYTSGTVVSVKPNKTVPVSLQAVAHFDWAMAVDELSGLWHIEGEDVSVFADGYVVANPNNPSYQTKTVENGRVVLDKAYAVIHVGLPYTSDIETLDIDTISGETIADKSKNTGKVTLYVEKTRGLFVGAKEPTGELLDGLTEIKSRLFENYDEPVDLATGKMDIIIRSEWNSNGRIFIRQIDPVPASILAIIPAGLYPFRG